MPVKHVLKVNGYGGRQAKGNEKRQCFKGVGNFSQKISPFNTLIMKANSIGNSILLKTR